MVFPWSLIDSKTPQVPRIFLSILADFNNSEVWMVSTFPLIFKSFSPFANHLWIVLCARITISICVTFMFHSYFSKVKVFISSYFLLILLWDLPIQQSPLFGRYSFFGWLSPDIVTWPWFGNLCTPKSQESFCASFSTTDSGLLPLVHRAKFQLVFFAQFLVCHNGTE